MARTLATSRTLGTRTLKANDTLSRDYQNSVRVPNQATAAGGALVPDATNIQNIFAGDGGAFSFWINPSSLGIASTGNFLNKNNGSMSGWFCKLAGSMAVRFTQSFSTSGAEWRIYNAGFKLNDWNFLFMWYNNTATSNSPVCYHCAKSSISTFAKPTVNNVTPANGVATSDVGISMSIGNINALTNRSGDCAITGVQLWKGAEPSQDDVKNLCYKNIPIPTMTLLDTWQRGDGTTFRSESGLLDAPITSPAILSTEVPFKSRTLAA